MRTSRAIPFLLITFGSSWSLAFGYWLLGGTWNTATSLVVATVYMFTPLLAAVVVQKLIAREAVFRPLGTRFRLNRWFAVAWLLPPLVSLGAFGVALLFPGVGYSPQMEGMLERFKDVLTPERYAQLTEQIESMPVHPMLMIVVQMLLSGATVNAVAGFGEELGWRGLLYEEWKHRGFWRMSLLTGLVWGVWHLPLVLQGHNFPHFPVAGVFLMILFCVLWSPLFTYVRMKSRSVIAAAVLHGSINASLGLAIVFVKGGNELLVGGMGLAGLLVLAAANVILFARVPAEAPVMAAEAAN